MPTGCNYAFWGVAFCFNSRNFYYLVLFQLRKQIQAHDCYFNMDTDTLQIWVLGTLHLRVLVVGFFNQHRQHISYQQKEALPSSYFYAVQRKVAFRSTPPKPIHITFYLDTWRKCYWRYSWQWNAAILDPLTTASSAESCPKTCFL